MIKVTNIKWGVDEDEKEALTNLPVNVTITGDDEKKIRIDSEGDETELLNLIIDWLTDTYEFCIESTGDISIEDDAPETPAGLSLDDESYFELLSKSAEDLPKEFFITKQDSTYEANCDVVRFNGTTKELKELMCGIVDDDITAMLKEDEEPMQYTSSAKHVNEFAAGKYVANVTYSDNHIVTIMAIDMGSVREISLQTKNTSILLLVFLYALSYLAK